MSKFRVLEHRIRLAFFPSAASVCQEMFHRYLIDARIIGWFPVGGAENRIRAKNPCVQSKFLLLNQRKDSDGRDWLCQACDSKSTRIQNRFMFLKTRKSECLLMNDPHVAGNCD